VPLGARRGLERRRSLRERGVGGAWWGLCCGYGGRWVQGQAAEAAGLQSLPFVTEVKDRLRLIVRSGSNEVTLWNADVPVDTWLRFAVDIRYTRDAENAKIQLWGDLRDTGDLSLKKYCWGLRRRLHPGTPHRLRQLAGRQVDAIEA
jgi:hypothetical protein